MRFSLGHQSTKANNSEAEPNFWTGYYDTQWATQEAPVEAWRFAIESLKEKANAPILFVYSPMTPYLKRGHVIRENPEKQLTEKFKNLCEQQGVGFLSMESDFLQFIREKGVFYKGFATSRPWAGHYNPNGHRLVAHAIHRWMTANPNAVHPD